MKVVSKVVIALWLAFSTALLPLANTGAQPLLPHLFYGDVTVGGGPAQAGTVITAMVKGTPRGSITVTRPGKYGDPNDPKLVVQGDDIQNGDLVEFFIGSVKANETFPFQSGEDTMLNLTFPALPTPTPTFTPTPTNTPPTGAPTGGGGVQIAPTPTPTPTLLEHLARIVVQVLTGAITLQEAAEELEKLPPEQAALVISQLDPQTAGRIFDELDTAFAAQIAEELTILTLAEVLVNTSPEKAGAIMSLLSIETVIALINAIAEEALINILPRMSLERFFQIPLEVLLNRLPSVPAEQLAFEVPPEPDPTLPPPVKTQVSDVLTIYNIPDTGERVWARLVGSPAPIEKIFGRFARRLTDIQLEVEDMPGKPPEAPDLPSDSIINSFFRIDVRNASPEDLQHAHLTLFVSKTWMKQNQVHDWSIQFNRLDPQLNIWVPFPTKRVLEDEERVFYTMVVPGFSVYALTGSVRLPPRRFEVTNLTITPAVPSVAAPGQDVTVSARVRNLSNSRAVYPASLWVDRSIEAVQAVVLEGGETRTVSFTLQRSEMKTYRVRMERLLGEFAVGTQPLTPTPTPTPTVTPTSTQTATPTSTPARALTPAPPAATLTPTAPALAPTAQPQAQAATATPVPPTPLATATVAAPAPQPTATPTPQSGGGIGVGLIVGVIVGLVVAGGAGVTIFQLMRRRG